DVVGPLEAPHEHSSGIVTHESDARVGEKRLGPQQNRQRDRDVGAERHAGEHDGLADAATFELAHRTRTRSSQQVALRDETRRAQRLVEGSALRTLARRHDDLREYRSEEHTSELQSREKLVCRLLLEKEK